MAGVRGEDRIMELVQAEVAARRQGTPVEGESAGDCRARFPHVRDDLTPRQRQWLRAIRTCFREHIAPSRSLRLTRKGRWTLPLWEKCQ